MPVSREDLNGALRRAIYSHPDLAKTRTRDARDAYFRRLDRFWSLWRDYHASPHRKEFTNKNGEGLRL